MKRRFRLKSTKDFERVRRFGKTYAHPLMVLIVLPNQTGQSRFGVAAGRSLGGAVHRNRAKRRLREALRHFADAILPGWDVLILARRPLASADYHQVRAGLESLLAKAELLTKPPAGS